MKYLSRISLSLAQTDPKRLAGWFCQNDYRDHQLIWRFFGGNPSVRRHFLYRREQGNGRLAFYVLSEDKPDTDEPMWRIESKPFEPKLDVNLPLEFSLRVNPVITRSTDEGRRHDVVMDYKKRLGYAELPKGLRPPLAQIVELTGLEWLEKKAQKGGFRFEEGAVRVDGYQQHMIAKPDSVTTRKPNIRNHFSSLDFNGILRVTDPDCFLKKTLCKGIGPAKAFGCGLLLVRRV